MPRMVEWEMMRGCAPCGVLLLDCRLRCLVVVFGCTLRCLLLLSGCVLSDAVLVGAAAVVRRERGEGGVARMDGCCGCCKEE